jgi:hypothetical protein
MQCPDLHVCKMAPGGICGHLHNLAGLEQLGEGFESSRARARATLLTLKYPAVDVRARSLSVTRSRSNYLLNRGAGRGRYLDRDQGGRHDHHDDYTYRGSSTPHQGTASFLPAVRQEDRSGPGPLCQVPRNAVALWLAAQALLQRPARGRRLRLEAHQRPPESFLSDSGAHKSLRCLSSCGERRTATTTSPRGGQDVHPGCRLQGRSPATGVAKMSDPGNSMFPPGWQLPAVGSPLVTRLRVGARPGVFVGLGTRAEQPRISGVFFRWGDPRNPTTEVSPSAAGGLSSGSSPRWCWVRKHSEARRPGFHVPWRPPSQTSRNTSRGVSHGCQRTCQA